MRPDKGCSDRRFGLRVGSSAELLPTDLEKKRHHALRLLGTVARRKTVQKTV